LGAGNVLVQLQLMRILGALFGALTVLFTFLFLRECLPGAPWAATAGALCIALQPLLAFMSGSVNPDSLLFAIAAVNFYCLARGFRRGLSRRLAAALGTVIALGFLTKLNYIGFAFGVYVGLAALGWRAARAGGPLRSPAIAGGIGAVPLMLYVLRNLLTGRPTLGVAASAINIATGKSLGDVLSYSWQLFLPRLPGMPHYFVGVDTLKDVWFDRSVGLYGFMDTMFPSWVENVALVPAGIVALLCARELYRQRHVLRARAAELITYVAICVGVLAMIGVSSYNSDVVTGEAAFAEPRYLLPMIPLLGAVVVLAIRGAGRRWAPATAAALVILFFGHDLVSQLQVVARYYG
jgi:4-amino-4-deoxy-L-arabinose transferase-like glycosyltransferase